MALAASVLIVELGNSAASDKVQLGWNHRVCVSVCVCVCVCVCVWWGGGRGTIHKMHVLGGQKPSSSLTGLTGLHVERPGVTEDPRTSKHSTHGLGFIS